MARLAVFSVVDWAFATVRDWAARSGHELAIVVTLAPSETAPGLRALHTAARGDTVVMVVPTPAACEAAVADLHVDLGIVFTFRRVPASLAALPRHGTVNLHPSLLPAYRGPNGMRSLYAGEPRLGATLHHLTPELDGGPILAQASEPTPEDVQPATALQTFQRTATAVLQAGVPLALAGAAGESQDPSAATQAPRFSEHERILDLGLTRRLFQCRLSALILAGLQPSVRLEDRIQPLRAARSVNGMPAGAPGVINLGARRATVAVVDGILELQLGEVPY